MKFNWSNSISSFLILMVINLALEALFGVSPLVSGVIGLVIYLTFIDRHYPIWSLKETNKE